MGIFSLPPMFFSVKLERARKHPKLPIPARQLMFHLPLHTSRSRKAYKDFHSVFSNGTYFNMNSFTHSRERLKHQLVHNSKQITRKHLFNKLLPCLLDEDCFKIFVSKRSR